MCVESEEEEKMEEVDSYEGSNEDLFTGSQIFWQPPPTVSNAKKFREWTYNLVVWTKSLTEEAKEQNLLKTKIWRLTVANFQALLNDQSVTLVPKMSAYEKERFKPILTLVQIELTKNESTAYQESTFSVAANNMSNFQTNMRSELL